MKIIIPYLLILLTTVVAIVTVGNLPQALGWSPERGLLLECALIGVVAGVLYCLRAIYVNIGLNRYDSNWQVWYFLRPITSGISGFASCVFLQAGLLALSSKPEPNATPYGYLAVAFIAGYNVDFFMKKIETIAKELWGIETSRVSRDAGSEEPAKSDKKEEQSK